MDIVSISCEQSTARTVGMLAAGQMLYLPAGWFHEVTSYGQQHIALSYWMHPPDNLTAGNEGFKRPYTSNFWPETWRALQGQVRNCERRGGCAEATMRTSTC